MFNSSSCPPKFVQTVECERKSLKWKDSAAYKFKFWFMNLAVSLYQLKTCIGAFSLLQTPVLTELVCCVSVCHALALPQPGNLPLPLSKPSVERAAWQRVKVTFRNCSHSNFGMLGETSLSCFNCTVAIIKALFSTPNVSSAAKLKRF